MTSALPLRVGAVAPLTPPGWPDAGRHLLAGIEAAVRELNANGGIDGRLIELLVRDTAGSVERAASAVEELDRLGAIALVGEYHSVVARAIADQADRRALPFLCASAVIDALTQRQTDWVVRLAPMQSRGWGVFADHLLAMGHRHVIAATTPSPYWSAGIHVLQQCFGRVGGAVRSFDVDAGPTSAMLDELAATHSTAVLLLIGKAKTAAEIINAVRTHPSLGDILFAAPAGQPELAEWRTVLGKDIAAIPFLRYMPVRMSALGQRVQSMLGERLQETPSFVAFEGYDTVTLLAAAVRLGGCTRAGVAGALSRVCVEGTRGTILLSRATGMQIRQWVEAPIQVVDHDPDVTDRLRVQYPVHP